MAGGTEALATLEAGSPVDDRASTSRTPLWEHPTEDSAEDRL